MYRDQYRKFSGSPQRGEVALDAYPEEGGEQFDAQQVYEDQQLGSYPTSQGPGVVGSGLENEDLRHMNNKHQEPEGGHRGVQF